MSNDRFGLWAQVYSCGTYIRLRCCILAADRLMEGGRLEGDGKNQILHPNVVSAHYGVYGILTSELKLYCLIQEAFS